MKRSVIIWSATDDKRIKKPNAEVQTPNQDQRPNKVRLWNGMVALK